MHKHPAPPAVWDDSKEVHFSPAPVRVLSLGGRKRLAGQQTGLSEGVKGTQILLTRLQTPLRSLPTSRWGHLAHGSHQLAHRQPQHSKLPTHAHPNPMVSSPCTLLMAVQASFSRWLVSPLKPGESAGQGQTTNLTPSTTPGKQKGGCQHLSWHIE